MNLIGSSKKLAVIGLGVTGVSVARFLTSKNSYFCMFDTREAPPSLNSFTSEFPNVDIYLGEMDEHALSDFDEIIVSPGISMQEACIQSAKKLGKPVYGDIELFLKEVHVPVVGITGSNGKTTVTTLVGLCAVESGLNAKVGGNIGTPALDLLDENADLYVLELSSFQLETIGKANLTLACNLNVTPDHMDRYGSFAQYVAAKQRIYYGAKSVVFNGEDVLTRPPEIDGVKRCQFSTERKVEENAIQYYWNSENNCLMCGQTPLMTVADLKIKGLHNVQNALSVFAVCDGLNIDKKDTVKVLSTFSGLPHRCQLVEEKNDVLFVNDSKATNVGAAEAAITGFVKMNYDVVLIAGGDGKGVDFKLFSQCIDKNVSAVILIGRDAEEIGKHLNSATPCRNAGSMKEAVAIAVSIANKNSVVLLSPACASFDMYSGYEERGEDFVRAVNEVVA